MVKTGVEKLTDDIENLNRDTNSTNQPLDKIFDKDKILEKEQAAKLFGEMGFEFAGKLAKEMGWEPGDPRRAMIHGIVGGLMAEISGGKFGEGLTTAAINKLVTDQLLIAVREEKIKLSSDELRWISASLGGIISDNQGAGISDSATTNNTVREIAAQLNPELAINGVILENKYLNSDELNTLLSSSETYQYGIDILVNGWENAIRREYPHFSDSQVSAMANTMRRELIAGGFDAIATQISFLPAGGITAYAIKEGVVHGLTIGTYIYIKEEYQGALGARDISYDVATNSIVSVISKKIPKRVNEYLSIPASLFVGKSIESIFPKDGGLTDNEREAYEKLGAEPR